MSNWSGVGTHRIAVHPKPSCEVVGGLVLADAFLGDDVLIHGVLTPEIPWLHSEVVEGRATETIVAHLEEHPRRLGRLGVSPSNGEGIGDIHLRHVVLWCGGTMLGYVQIDGSYEWVRVG